MKENPHKEHRLRVKARFRNQGLEGFEPHQVVELLLFFGIPQGDTNTIAHELIKTFGSYNRLLDADYNELLKINGIGEHTATLIKLMSPLFRYYSMNADIKQVSFDSPDNVGDYLVNCFAGYTEEVVMMVSLDGMCRVLSIDDLGKGDVGSAVISSRKLIEAAIRTNASAVILCHNHPGGIALPSAEDLAATMRLAKSLKDIHVSLVDHFILAGNDYISLYQSENYKYIFKV